MQHDLSRNHQLKNLTTTPKAFGAGNALTKRYGVPASAGQPIRKPHVFEPPHTLRIGTAFSSDLENECSWGLPSTEGEASQQRSSTGAVLMHLLQFPAFLRLCA